MLQQQLGPVPGQIEQPLLLPELVPVHVPAPVLAALQDSLHYAHPMLLGHQLPPAFGLGHWPDPNQLPPGEVLLGAEGHPNSLNLQLVALPVLLVQPAGPGMVVVEPLLALLALLAGLQLVVQLAAQPAAQPLAALPAGLVGQLFAELELLALAEQPAVHALVLEPPVLPVALSAVLARSEPSPAHFGWQPEQQQQRVQQHSGVVQVGLVERRADLGQSHLVEVDQLQDLEVVVGQAMAVANLEGQVLAVVVQAVDPEAPQAHPREEGAPKQLDQRGFVATEKRSLVAAQGAVAPLAKVVRPPSDLRGSGQHNLGRHAGQGLGKAEPERPVLPTEPTNPP